MAKPDKENPEAVKPEKPVLEQKGSMQPTPVLSLRDVVVYPHMVIPLFVGRDRSILALDQSMNIDKRIVLATQRSAEIDEPTESDLFKVGTLATV
ncbi:MAG TPA: LON peptidase substrate-binding domain-containing protein, partial [Paracoccaceae bacterium]|nr:LON peptidase substrate-binding domain-containing protein [Paracoccaceae bacterium]